MTRAQLQTQINTFNNRANHIGRTRTQLSSAANSNVNNVNTMINNVISSLARGINHSTANNRIQGIFGNNTEQPVSGDSNLGQADNSLILEQQAAQRRASELTEQRNAL